VKLPDVNLLLYALDETSLHHPRARLWLEALLSGTEPAGFAWSVLLAFVRLSSRHQLFASPLHPTERHLAVLRGLVEPLGTAGNITTDAHLAALAIEHGGEICSADTDFARFPGLRWTNPLAADD
jgi:predicted nucleic acid-binding protein